MAGHQASEAVIPDPAAMFAEASKSTIGVIPRPSYMEEKATPASFGASVGQAMETAGAEGEQAAKTMGDTTLRVMQLQNDKALNDATKQYSDISIGHFLDPKTGLYSLEGQNAVNAAPGIMAANEQARQKIRDSLPMHSAMQFDRETQATQRYLIDQAYRHIDGQQKVAALQSMQDSLSSDASTAIMSLSNPGISSNGFGPETLINQS